MESFYVYQLQGKIPYFQYDKFEKKSFTKRAIVYEHSWLSSQRAKMTVIFIALFSIVCPNQTHRCVLALETMLPNIVSNFFVQKNQFSFSKCQNGCFLLFMYKNGGAKWHHSNYHNKVTIFSAQFPSFMDFLVLQLLSHI